MKQAGVPTVSGSDGALNDDPDENIKIARNLSFTPCVLPMIPILSGILAGEGEEISSSRGFSLALCYVMGMA